MIGLIEWLVLVVAVVVLLLLLLLLSEDRCHNTKTPMLLIASVEEKEEEKEVLELELLLVDALFFAVSTMASYIPYLRLTTYLLLLFWSTDDMFTSWYFPPGRWTIPNSSRSVDALPSWSSACCWLTMGK